VVEIVVNGAGGSVVYHEAGHAHSFGWDLGTGNVLATIYVPSSTEWDATLPWAAGRREQILDVIAREVRRAKAPGSRIEIEDRWIRLVAPPPLPRRIARALRNFFGSFRENG
jgi:hypothetical protein